MYVDFYTETDVLFTDESIFGDNEEHTFVCTCFDGYAQCTAVNEGESVTELEVTYPTLAEILADDKKCEEILVYRGLYDKDKKDITYGDIMLKYGQITPIFEVGDLVKWNDPAINDFNAEERELQKNRVFKIYDVNGDVIGICDEYGESEVLAHELMLVKKSGKNL